MVAFRPHHGHAILLLEHQLIVLMTWWDLKSSGGARPVCIPMPECPPATVAERHEGTLSASGFFGVKFILFQLLGTLLNYLIRILE